MPLCLFLRSVCPVYVNAEKTVADSLNVPVEKVHLREQPSRIAEAFGVKSVPASVINGQAFHINHRADMSALK